MALSLAGLEYLRHVADAGSFAAAARRTGVSQPAVSQHVKRLEKQYGVKLFTRSHGRLVPTPLCNSLCSFAERVMEERVTAERLLRRHSSMEAGEITLGLGNMMPGMAVISAFHRSYPSIRLRVETGSHERVTRLVLTQEVDVGILPDVPPDPRFRRERLVGNEVLAIVPLTHPMAARAQVGAAELAREKLIFRTRGSSTQRAVERMFRRAGGVPDPFLTLDTRDGVYEAVAQGMGIGFIWKNGTGRTDSVHRVRIAEMSTASEEIAFSLADLDSDVVGAFFRLVRTWRREGGHDGPEALP